MNLTLQTDLYARPTTRSLALALAVAGALGTAPAARAAVAAGAAGGALDEIVVTANRRSQSVLDVPYNISALTGATLEAAGVTNLTSIARLLPGVSIPDVGQRANSSNSLIIIRGMNVNDPVNSAYLPWGSVPTVSTYIDDVPLYVNLKLDDIQRVEVLRGPQGTLYGSGAVGGTVKIVHNQPDLKAFSAELSMDGSKTDHASQDSYGVKGVLNVPLSPTLGFRMSAGFDRTAGFINAANAVVFTPHQQPVLADPANPVTSGLTYQTLNHIDDARSLGLRTTLLWKPAAGFDVTLAYQRQDDHSNGFSSQTLGDTNYTQALVAQQTEHRRVRPVGHDQAGPGCGGRRHVEGARVLGRQRPGHRRTGRSGPGAGLLPLRFGRQPAAGRARRGEHRAPPDLRGRRRRGDRPRRAAGADLQPDQAARSHARQPRHPSAG